MFKHTIVRTPCSKVCDGITSAPELGKPVYEKALEQHAKYVEALKACGVDVKVLPPLEDYPDSCFMEDVAVLTAKCAVVTNTGAESRNGEKEAVVDALKSKQAEQNPVAPVAPAVVPPAPSHAPAAPKKGVYVGGQNFSDDF